MPVVRESIEMLYQFEDDYRFDSTKAEQAFGLTIIDSLLVAARS